MQTHNKHNEDVQTRCAATFYETSRATNHVSLQHHVRLIKWQLRSGHDRVLTFVVSASHCVRKSELAVTICDKVYRLAKNGRPLRATHLRINTPRNWQPDSLIQTGLKVSATSLPYTRHGCMHGAPTAPSTSCTRLQHTCLLWAQIQILQDSTKCLQVCRKSSGCSAHNLEGLQGHSRLRWM